MNSMATSAVPKKSWKKRTKMPKSEPKFSASKEYGRTHGIDCLNLSTAENDLESESKWILVKVRKVQIENNKDIIISTRQKCKFLSDILHPTKRTKT